MHVVKIALSVPNLEKCSMHAHDEWELVMCLNGHCSLRLGTEKVELSSGVIVLQPPGMMHGFAGAKDYQDLSLRISGFAPISGEGMAVFKDDASQRCRTLLMMMYEAFLQGEPQGEAFVDSLWQAVYQLLMNRSMNNARSVVVSRMIHDMVRHLSESGWQIGDASGSSGYSADHLRRLFKKEMGMTPNDYLTHLRIDHARRLLALSDHGGYTIKQIALMSGFQDPYYFSRLFKKMTGSSPSEYHVFDQAD